MVRMEFDPSDDLQAETVTSCKNIFHVMYYMSQDGEDSLRASSSAAAPRRAAAPQLLSQQIS